MGRVRRYAVIAAFARAHEHPDVTEWTVQGWIKAGLLPRSDPAAPRIDRHDGALTPELERQVLAICELHYDQKIRSLKLIAAILWSRGFPITDEHVRHSLTFLADPPWRLLMATRAPDADHWDVANIAVHESGFGADANGPAISKLHLAAGLGDLFAMLAGELSPADAADADLNAVATMMGLDLAAVTGSASPQAWLQLSPAAALRTVIPALQANVLRVAIASASHEDLSKARDAAAVISGALLRLVDARALVGDVDVGGLGRVAPYLRSPVGLALVAIVVMATPQASMEYAESLEKSEPTRAGIND